MDFLRKLFRKEERGKDKPARLSIPDLEEWLKEEKNKRQRRTFKEARPILDEVYGIIGDIKEIALRIEDMEPPEEIPGRARKVIQTSKPEFIRGILDSIKDANPGKDEDFIPAKKRADDTIISLLKVSTGQGRYLPLAFGQELEELGKRLKELVRKKKALDEIENKADGELTNLEEDIRRLKDCLHTLSTLKDEKERLASDLETLEKEGTKLDKEYKSLEKSGEYREYLAAEKELEKTKNKADEIENDIYNLITPLKRPLRKIKKSSGEDVKGAVNELEKYVENPKEILYAADPAGITALLEDLKKRIQDDETTTGTERDKALNRIKTFTGTDIRKTAEEYKTLKKQEEEKDKTLKSNPAIMKKAGLTTRIERNTRDAGLRKQDMDKAEKKTWKMDDEIKALTGRIEDKAGSLMGKKIALETE